MSCNVSSYFIRLYIISNRAADGQRNEWISAIKNYQQVDDSHAQILLCELHFDPKSITKRKDRNVLKSGTVPTVFTDLHRYESFGTNSSLLIHIPSAFFCIFFGN